MNCGIISIRNHIHYLFSISLLSPPSLHLPTSELQKLNYQHFKTKVPEAWYEQEDKYNLFLLSFLFLFFCHFFYNTYSLSLFCSFCDVKFERCPQTFELLLVVHSQSVCFGRALLWHRCCKKKKRNREVKLQTDHQSEFFGISLFLSRFQEKSFLWRETWRDSQKSPINILVQKTLSSLVRPLHLSSSSLLEKKKDLWFGWIRILSSRMNVALMSEVSQLSQNCKQSDYVHTKPTKSENALEEWRPFSGSFPKDLRPHWNARTTGEQ